MTNHHQAQTVQVAPPPAQPQPAHLPPTFAGYAAAVIGGYTNTGPTNTSSGNRRNSGGNSSSNRRQSSPGDSSQISSSVAGAMSYQQQQLSYAQRLAGATNLQGMFILYKVCTSLENPAI